jgi:hypothetical protein
MVSPKFKGGWEECWGHHTGMVSPIFKGGKEEYCGPPYRYGGWGIFRRTKRKAQSGPPHSPTVQAVAAHGKKFKVMVFEEGDRVLVCTRARAFSIGKLIARWRFEGSVHAVRKGFRYIVKCGKSGGPDGEAAGARYQRTRFHQPD